MSSLGDGQRAGSKVNRPLAGWVLAWFMVTALVCTWDATFIMMRPHSLPGGSWASVWYLYKYYVTVDQRYNDLSDPFVFAQSLLNYVEVFLNIVAIILHYRGSRHAGLTAFTVSVMTMWKTVLYFLMFSELCTGGQYRVGNTALQEFWLVVVPNIIWIILPLCVMFSLWQSLTNRTLPDHSKSDRSETGQLFTKSSNGHSYPIYGREASDTTAVKRNRK